MNLKRKYCTVCDRRQDPNNKECQKCGGWLKFIYYDTKSKKITRVKDNE